MKFAQSGHRREVEDRSALAGFEPPAMESHERIVRALALERAIRLAT